jgi:hypothetical protein
MTEDIAEFNHDLSVDSYDLSTDDELDEVQASISGRHRNLLDGEIVPSNTTMYQQLAMVLRGGYWMLREDLQINGLDGNNQNQIDMQV